MTFIVDGSLGGTFPSWTTATRPSSPANGQMGYNSTTGSFDQYTSSAWSSVGTNFASGTKMMFVQTAAPTGWTKVTTYNDYALRVVSGTASTGGSVAFTTAFASQTPAGTVGTSGATTLSTSQIPSHNHSIPGDIGNPGGAQGISGSASLGGSYGSIINVTGGGGSHTHTGGTFTGTAINLAVSYVDTIIATKD